MGKNSIIKSLGKIIGNIAMHKLILENTKKPESKSYLKNEILEYSADALEKSQEFNWNDNDKLEIKEKSVIRVKNLSNYYKDIRFSESDIEYFVDEIMRELELLN